jgi:hypothetical protein
MCLSSFWVYPQERDRLIYADLGVKGLVLSLHAGPACGRWLILLTDCAVAMGKPGCQTGRLFSYMVLSPVGHKCRLFCTILV